MGIPNTYNNLTVKEYIKVMAIVEDKSLDLIDRKALLINHFTGLDAYEMPLADLVKYREQVDMLLLSQINLKIVQGISVNGKEYWTDTDVTNLCTDQYTGVKEFGKDTMGNFNKLLGLIYYRNDSGKPKYDSEQFKDIGNELMEAPIGLVYGAVFFYSKVLEQLNHVLPIYLAIAQNEIETEMNSLIMEAKQDGVNLQEIMGGTM